MMADPTVEGTGEYVEVLNTGSAAVDDAAIASGEHAASASEIAWWAQRGLHPERSEGTNPAGATAKVVGPAGIEPARFRLWGKLLK